MATRRYLFGYLTDDFFGRVIVAGADQRVSGLAAQLIAWGVPGDRQGAATVTNEAGAVLDPTMTITQAGLDNGDIFTVDRAR
jgi:hypothetical protein